MNQTQHQTPSEWPEIKPLTREALRNMVTSQVIWTENRSLIPHRWRRWLWLLLALALFVLFLLLYVYPALA